MQLVYVAQSKQPSLGEKLASCLPLFFVVKSLFRDFIKGSVKWQGNIEILRKTFYELDEFAAFYVAALKGHPRIITGSSDHAVVTLSAPYSYFNASVTKENMKQSESFFLENKTARIYFNYEAET